MRLACPLDEFNAARHVNDDAPSADAPPTPERVAAFFESSRRGSRPRASTARPLGTTRCSARCITPGSDRKRSSCSTALTCTSGAARSANCMCGSGKAPRDPGHDPGGCRCWTGWIPDSSVLLCDESGGRMAAATIRNRLRHLMSVEGRPEAEWFSPHAMRRACATHNYERGVDLAAIQQLLDHWTVASTMRYVRPSETFIEDARLNARRKARGSEKPNRRASTVIGTPWCSASTARAVRCSSRNRRRDIPSPATTAAGATG